MGDKSDILVVIAHPDDEVFASGTICLCAEKGFRIAFVCATDGEGGSRDLILSKPDLPLGEIRRQELMLSARILGASEVCFLGQPDSALPDAEGEGSWDQPSLISTLGNVIRQHNPQLILTHGPQGGYGHPAHRLLYRCVAAAAQTVSFAGSIFSFCGKVDGAFFSWHFDQPSDVLVDARTFLRPSRGQPLVSSDPGCLLRAASFSSQRSEARIGHIRTRVFIYSRRAQARSNCDSNKIFPEISHRRTRFAEGPGCRPSSFLSGALPE